MGLFNEIFSGQKLSSPINFANLGVDIHSHLIPAIDDGVSSFEEAVELIRRLNELGIKKIITTPHVMQDYYRNTNEIIIRGCDSLRLILEQEKIAVELETAAEYMIDDGFEAKQKEGKLLTFGDNYILVELSYYFPHPNLSSIIFNLQIEGYKVILAHPERYVYWHNNISKYEELKNKGVYFQLNTISLANSYSPAVQRTAEKLIRNEMIEFVGSDMHNKLTLERIEISRYSKTLKLLIESGKLLNSSLL